jgi:heat-inducible transcriptional repressor
MVGRVRANMAESDLAGRSQQVLKALIEHYISDGQPVGSKMLSTAASLSLSSASIRNVMADLEAMGYVRSPHTSAGRIPTVRGYRFFVDSLITMQPIQGPALQQLQCSLNADLSRGELVDVASRLLSEVSMQAGLVTLPQAEDEILRQVEFLPLSGDRVLVVLVVNEKEVQNRIIHPRREFSEEELKQASNFINSHYAGRPLSLVHQTLLGEMQSDKDALTRLMQSAIDLAGQAFGDQRRKDYLLAGESHLLGREAAGDMAGLRGLFQAFEHKKDILDLMERCMDAEGTQVYIGEESGFEVLDDYSVITTAYQLSGNKVGVLGVIGPTRMAYERVIPLVDITAKLLSAALEQS